MVFANDVKKIPLCGLVFDESDPNRSMNNFLHLRWCQVIRCRTTRILPYNVISIHSIYINNKTVKPRYNEF